MGGKYPLAQVLTWRQVPRHPGLVALGMILGVVLGYIFFYAGMRKHLEISAFVEAALAYRLGPQFLAVVGAAVVPWLELTVGFFLVLGYFLEAVGRLGVILGWQGGESLVGGIKRRSCFLLIMGAAAVFVVVLLITLARGLKIDCGCGLFFQRQVGWAVILQDVLIFVVAFALYQWELPPEEPGN